MLKFILNNQKIETELPGGMTVLDFVRHRKNLKGTKIGCREGDCGACTVLVGELQNNNIRYRTQTSCLMPLANAAGKHIVTIEGINKDAGLLTPVQNALTEELGTQCGFCTVGFVMSLTGFCLGDSEKTSANAVAAIDGNICRCTGYKSIQRAATKIAEAQKTHKADHTQVECAISNGIVPEYFAEIAQHLRSILPEEKLPEKTAKIYLGGGTDLYVQKPEEMTNANSQTLFDKRELNFIRESGDEIEFGGAVVVTDIFESKLFQMRFPKLREHLQLVSSTPIRNMATIAGNFVNASPIGDMTVWFLALNASVSLYDVKTEFERKIPLSEFFLGYKQIAKSEAEIISAVSFKRDFTHFNFEKVSKRRFLDIASVNTAISLRLAYGETPKPKINTAFVSCGGVAPVPLFLKETSKFLLGKLIEKSTVDEACKIIQEEISPISDVRGSEAYKRKLLNNLIRAHFYELFSVEVS
ncbi:MAG: FAD binding domain-containing protein [Pyrinomonadaceae bacterium]